MHVSLRQFQKPPFRMPMEVSKKSPQKGETGRWKSLTRIGISSPRLLLLVGTLVGAIGVSGLVIWVNWTKWIVFRWEHQLPNLPVEEAIELLHQMGAWTPASIPVLVQGLCDSRQQVAEAARQQFQTLQHQWENQAWHQVVGSLFLLARTLDRRKEDLPAHSRQTVRQLAEWILTWRPPESSSERVQMVLSCEKVLTYLNQFGASSGEPAKGTEKLSSTQRSGVPGPLGELIDPLQGFHLAGGGLSIQRDAAQSVEGDGGQQPPLFPDGHRDSPPETRYSLRIVEPLQAEEFSKLSRQTAVQPEIPPSEARKPRMNHPLRVGQGGDLGGLGSEAVSGPAKKTSKAWGQKNLSSNMNEETSPQGRREERDNWVGWSPDRTEELRKKNIRQLVALLVESSAEEQSAIQAELARRGLGEVSREFARQVCDPNPQVRLDLVRRLPSMSGVEPAAWLLWLCEDPDAQVRAAARTLLATTNDPAILQQLEKMLSGNSEEPLRLQTERIRAVRQERLR